MLKRLRKNELIEINSTNPILGFPVRKAVKSFSEIDKTDFNKWGKLKLLTIWLPDERFGDIWLESL